MKRLLSGILALVAVLSLCACGSKKTPEEVFKLTAENMKKVDSGIFYINEEMSIRENGVEMGGKIQSELEVCSDPGTLHGKFNLTIAMINLNMELYWLPEEDAFYVGMDMGSGMQWYGQKGSGEELPKLPEMWENPDFVILDYCENLTEVGKEKVGDVNTTRYDARLTVRGLRKLAQDLLDAIDKENGGTPKELVGLREHLEEFLASVDENAGATLTFCINTKKMEMVEVRAEFTELANELFRAFGKSQTEEPDAEITRLELVCGFRELGQIKHIEIPQEVLDAPEL